MLTNAAWQKSVNSLPFRKIPQTFYQQAVLNVELKLLGKFLVKREEETCLVGKIVEVEAYDARFDEASHSFKGKTARNKVMFQEGGYLYVYFIYGNHFCCNVVCDKKEVGAAVLIRGIEPVSGIDVMSKRRFGKKEISAKELVNLTNGPGKICKAFGIRREENGTPLFGDTLFLAEGEKIKTTSIGITSRIGIKKAKELPWRFFIKENTFVSAL